MAGDHWPTTPFIDAAGVKVWSITDTRVVAGICTWVSPEVPTLLFCTSVFHAGVVGVVIAAAMSSVAILTRR